MRKIRIAQIGINYISHGKEVFETLSRFPALFEIVGYAIVENERETCYKKLGCFEGYRELSVEEILNDPTIEAVTVETDEIHLLKYALMAAEHGKHIHMEKPGSPCLADFERLVTLQKESGRVLHLGYMYRYNPMIEDLLSRVREGELGEIFSVEAQMSCRHPTKVRTLLSDFPGGMTFYLGCHLIDLVLQIQGAPTRILPLNRSTGYEGVKAEDFGMAVLEYPNGISFIKTTACEIGGFARRQLVVSGTRGTVEIKPLECVVEGDGYALTTTETVYTDEKSWHTKGETTDSEPYDRYARMMDRFAAMVRGEYENPYSYDYERMLFRTLLACCGVGNTEQGECHEGL